MGFRMSGPVKPLIFYNNGAPNKFWVKPMKCSDKPWNVLNIFPLQPIHLSSIQYTLQSNIAMENYPFKDYLPK